MATNICLNYSKKDLFKVCLEKINYINRDFREFSKFGVSRKEIANLKQNVGLLIHKQPNSQQIKLTLNSIYADINELCSIGKIIWAEINENNYNDYVILPQLKRNPTSINKREQEKLAS